ncbi:hypothetical protein BCR32DRAFT_239808 [Anaeromyces robustus]|uniref:SP-RING-type domain-containing protein n=1 Tax=Anaeromyces robustus TaxID=1754192 RepID=A0A1Y1XQ66_9FUNG|nr:hypothetical protein BCR32DRAFT_239808 [Anaeromyces robustus]|eukprot:ORX87899.1 hypothetical protein BCR32DRAFT_239808 [Anaeromyces robustus]
MNNQYPYIPNNNANMIPEQQRSPQCNPSYNNIPNSNLSYTINSERIQQNQIPLMNTSNINSFQLYPQQNANNNFNMYYTNSSIPNNSNNQSLLNNSRQTQINYLNSLQRPSPQQLYNSRISTYSRIQNQQINSQLLRQQQIRQNLLQQNQIHIPQQQLNQNILQQAQLQIQQQNLQQFHNPLTQKAPNDQRKQIQHIQQLQQLQQLHQQQQQQQQQQHLQQQQQQQQQQHLQQQQQQQLQQLQQQRQQQQLQLQFQQQNNQVNQQHKSQVLHNVQKSTLNDSNESFDNTKVKLEKKPFIRKFFRPLIPLILPWELKLENKRNTFSNKFTILEELYNVLYFNKINNIKQYYVFISCYEKGDEVKMTWPFYIKEIRCNDKTLDLVRKTPIYGNDGHLLQTNGIDCPYDLTNYLKEDNVIEIITDKIDKCLDDKIIHANFNIVFNILETEDEFKKQTGGNLSNSDDDDLIIVDPNITISLKCPISLIRIMNPVRGKRCQHLQTFDLDSYLSINYKHGKWACPICNKKTTTSDLQFDEWYNNLLNEIPEDIEKIQIDKNGKYIINKEVKEKTNSPQIIYNLDDDDLEENDSDNKIEKKINIKNNQKSENMIGNSNLNKNVKTNTNNNNTIDNMNNNIINMQNINNNNNSPAINSKGNNEEDLQSHQKRQREEDLHFNQYITDNNIHQLKKKNNNNSQQILKPQSNINKELPDIGSIKFNPIFDKLMNAATTLNFDNIFNK